MDNKPLNQPPDERKTADYEAWERSWNDSIDEVDDHIMDWFRHAREETQENMAELGERMKYFFDRRKLDPVSKAEYEKFKGDSKLLAAKIQNRVNHLIQDGKIAWARATGQDRA